MTLISDFHTHSNHSGDSNARMEDLAEAAIRKGLSCLCFTEHNDFDYPESPDCPAGTFDLNADSYLYDFIRCKEQYADRIRLLFGVELGLTPENVRKNLMFSKGYDFDFIIGSSHLCKGKDPYYESYYEGRGDREVFEEYFASVLENIRKFRNFDVYGHLDYIIRYCPNRDSNYSYTDYLDILDQILTLLIENEKGIEINTGGFVSGLKDVHPCTGIIRRYKELGGEIITVGSDAHTPEAVGGGFQKAAEVLAAAGFRYYSIFEKRLPTFQKL